MAGSLLLVRTIRRPDIRAEGRRQGYQGRDLDDFVEIVAAFDDERVALINKKSAADFKASIPKNRR